MAAKACGVALRGSYELDQQGRQEAPRADDLLLHQHVNNTLRTYQQPGRLCEGRKTSTLFADHVTYSEHSMYGLLRISGRSGHAPEEVQLMRNIYQRFLLDLGVALSDPVRQVARV
jgi:hypothetical protein